MRISYLRLVRPGDSAGSFAMVCGGPASRMPRRSWVLSWSRRALFTSEETAMTVAQLNWALWLVGPGDFGDFGLLDQSIFLASTHPFTNYN